MTEYPRTLIWPADTKAGLPAGRWRRLEDGRIEAVYESQQELDLCLEFARLEASRNGASLEMTWRRIRALWKREGWLAEARQEVMW